MFYEETFGTVRNVSKLNQKEDASLITHPLFDNYRVSHNLANRKFYFPSQFSIKSLLNYEASDRLTKCLYPRLRSSQYQRVNIMRTFIGIHRFQIHYMPDDMIFIGDAVAAVHIARGARDLK